MIVFGERNIELLRKRLPDKCTHCNMENSITMYVFQGVVHICWIPLVPLKKKGISECSHCKQVLEYNEMPYTLFNAYEKLESQTKTPIWSFAALALIISVVAVIFIFNQLNHHKNSKSILSPQAGDTYKIKTQENKYTICKVNKVQGDSVFVQGSKYEVDDKSGLDDLKNKSYSKAIFAVPKNKLKEMFDKGIIFDIDRE